jgi:hypothetical protein
VNLSARKTLKVHTTEFTNDVIQLLRFLKSAFTDNPWKHGLDFVCDKFVPCFAMEVTLHKASLNSLTARILATVVGVASLVLEMGFHLALCVERMEAVIIAALEGFEWGQLSCHSSGDAVIEVGCAVDIQCWEEYRVTIRDRRERVLYWRREVVSWGKKETKVEGRRIGYRGLRLDVKDGKIPKLRGWRFSCEDGGKQSFGAVVA